MGSARRGRMQAARVAAGRAAGLTGEAKYRAKKKNPFRKKR